jgi:hypothetical protein
MNNEKAAATAEQKERFWPNVEKTAERWVWKGIASFGITP